MLEIDERALRTLRRVFPELRKLGASQIKDLMIAVRMLEHARPPPDTIMSQRDVAIWVGAKSNEQLKMWLEASNGPKPVIERVHSPMQMDFYLAGDISTWLDKLAEKSENLPAIKQTKKEVRKRDSEELACA